MPPRSSHGATSNFPKNENRDDSHRRGFVVFQGDIVSACDACVYALFIIIIIIIVGNPQQLPHGTRLSLGGTCQTFHIDGFVMSRRRYRGF